jgi:menaquinol-cytochrome c reductase iron-sulfur subunit
MENNNQNHKNHQCNGHNCPFNNQLNRRSMMKRFIGILTAPLFVLLAWPFIQSVIGTIFRLPKSHYAKVGPMDSFSNSKPVSPKFKYAAEDEYIHSAELYNVWVIKHSEQKVTVFSPICPHLGCRYDWYPEANKFMCPCHGSIYSINGKVLGGPAPRGLDTLPWKIENGDLYVKWERFRVGIPQKIRIG